MAAGQGFKTFATGDVLTAADTNGYLMQGVLVFASAATRDAAITSPQEGQFAYLKDTNVTTYYTGSAWANLDTTGMTNPMTTTGDTIYSSSGSTPARLGIGTANQVLRVNSGATAPEWATLSSGGWTLISTTTLSGANVDLSFTTGYKKIVLWLTDFYVAGAGAFCGVQLNSSGSNYTNFYPEINITANTVQYAAYFSNADSVIQVMPAGMASSNNDGVCVLEIDAPDETNMMKTYRGITRYTNSAGSNMVYNTTGVWRDSTAVTSLRVKAGNSTWSGGTAYLYGVK
jgi:hypothetical protein